MKHIRVLQDKETSSQNQYQTLLNIILPNYYQLVISSTNFLQLVYALFQQQQLNKKLTLLSVFIFIYKIIYIRSIYIYIYIESYIHLDLMGVTQLSKFCFRLIKVAHVHLSWSSKLTSSSLKSFDYNAFWQDIVFNYQFY